MGSKRLGPGRNLPLFVYGTLVDPAFVSSLLERPVPREAARLRDHALLPDPTLPWPTLFPTRGRETEGWLYRGLGPEDYRRLDHYEGVDEGLYRRVEARCSLPGASGEEDAFVYLMSAVPFVAL